MLEVVVSARYPRSVQEVAERCGRFDALAEWHPAYHPLGVEGEGPHRVRAYALGGALARDELLSEDEDGRGYAYGVLVHPLPITGARGQIHVAPLRYEEGGASGCEVTWSFACRPTMPIPEEGLSKALEGLMRLGLEALGVGLAATPRADAEDDPESPWAPDVTEPDASPAPTWGDDSAETTRRWVPPGDRGE